MIKQWRELSNEEQMYELDRGREYMRNLCKKEISTLTTTEERAHWLAYNWLLFEEEGGTLEQRKARWLPMMEEIFAELEQAGPDINADRILQIRDDLTARNEMRRLLEFVRIGPELIRILKKIEAEKDSAEGRSEK